MKRTTQPPSLLATGLALLLVGGVLSGALPAATLPPAAAPTSAPAPTLLRAEVPAWIHGQGVNDPAHDWNPEDFFTMVGDKPRYTQADLKKFHPLPREKPKTEPAQVKPSGPASKVDPDSDRTDDFTLDAVHLHIRAKYDDVLATEDGTVTRPAAKVGDLTGATGSYTRDFNSDSDAWSVKGALLVPLIISRKTSGPDFELRSFGVVPSISFDRETNKDPTKNVDSLIFRVGGYEKWTGGGWLTALSLRVFGTYATDFHFQSETPAAEFQVEPTIKGNHYFGIGSRHSLWTVPNPKATPDSDDWEKRKTILAYQLRLYLHGEYGRTVDVGKKKELVEGDDFFRLGPKIQLRLDPFFVDKFICTVNYEYLGDLVGSSPRHGLLTIEPEYVFNKPAADATELDKPVISLKASYQDGGIDITKQRVHTLMLGIGVTL